MSRIAALEARFEALQPRERTLASLAVGVLLVLFLFLLWIEPAQKAADARRTQIETLAPQVDAQRAALERVRAELAVDPEAARRALLDQLRGEAGSLDGELREDQAQVIPPSRMPALLRELMGETAGLRVVGVETLPPEVLRWTPAPSQSDTAAPTVEPAPTAGVAPAPTESTTAASAPNAPAASLPADLPALYRHRVVLRFEGDYAATLAYLRAVEAQPLRVRLDDLEVDATRWPVLSITLQVETLGLGEGWIGV